MKGIILNTLFLVTVCAYGQAPKNAYYMKLMGGTGNYDFVGISLNHANKKDFSVSVFYTGENKNSPNVPRDYKSGFCIFCPGVPQVYITSYGFTYGRIFRPKTKLLSYDIKAGPLFGTIERPGNFTKRAGGGFLDMGSNYYYTTETKWFGGIMLNPSIDFLFSRYVGLSVGFHSNINAQDITVGFEGALLIGRLR